MIIKFLPRTIILGNYESRSNADEWLSEFKRLNVSAIENGVEIATPIKVMVV